MNAMVQLSVSNDLCFDLKSFCTVQHNNFMGLNVIYAKFELSQCWPVVAHSNHARCGLIHGFCRPHVFCLPAVRECTVCFKCHSCLLSAFAPSIPSFSLVTVSIRGRKYLH